MTTRRTLPDTPASFRPAFAALACVAALAGCASATPAFDDAFGKTVPRLMAQQIKDPEAAVRNRERPVDGIDGRAAREAMDRYYNSFRAPPPPGNTFVIGVGGVAGGAGAAPAAQ